MRLFKVELLSLYRMVTFVILAFFLFGMVSMAFSEAAFGLDTRMIADMNKPGVLMIQTINSATITVPEAQISDEGLQALEQVVVDLIQSGQIPNTDEAIVKALIGELLENPFNYLTPSGKLITKDTQTGAIGTGFIVTEDGYIITNAHVVYTEEKALKMQLAWAGLQDIIQQDVEDFTSGLEDYDYTVTQEEIEKLQNIALQFYASNLQLDNVKTQSYAAMGISIPGLQTVQKGYPCDVRKRGEPIPGKDVAILKIDQKNLPTVTLGDDASMQTGDPVYVLGYPGVATFNPLISQESYLETSFTSGIVSARKTMTGGWEVLQIDAAITHGNSGGPVFNSSGEVIGIATFGSIDPNNQVEVQGMNFAFPINIAKQFLKEINVTPQESRLTTKYKDALVLYQQEKYKKALEIFREINETNPGYPYVQDMIAGSRTAIDQGKDKSFNYLPVILGGVAVVAVAGGAFVWMRKKPK
jgi:S1-C subfamily serine protease